MGLERVGAFQDFRRCGHVQIGISRKMMTDEDEKVLADGFINDRFLTILFKHFPFEVEIEESSYAHDYCEQNFGKRLLLSRKNGRFDHTLKWEWYNNPLFKDEHDAVMFKLGYPGK
jgi:hypothetical protein